MKAIDNNTLSRNLFADPQPASKCIGVCAVCGCEVFDYENVYPVTDEVAVHEECVNGLRIDEVLKWLDMKPSDTFRSVGASGRLFLNAFDIYAQRADEDKTEDLY